MMLHSHVRIFLSFSPDHMRTRDQTNLDCGFKVFSVCPDDVLQDYVMDN
jgi:hypothetical protein